MVEIDNRLFEGDHFRRVPKKDWGLEGQFELAGAMVAHSVTHGGPALCTNMCPSLHLVM